jgi:hypothetical protein
VSSPPVVVGATVVVAVDEVEVVASVVVATPGPHAKMAERTGNSADVDRMTQDRAVPRGCRRELPPARHVLAARRQKFHG